jgi:hypothetical protein
MQFHEAKDRLDDLAFRQNVTSKSANDIDKNELPGKTRITDQVI